MAIYHLVLDTKRKAKKQSSLAKYNYDHRKEKFEINKSQVAYDAFFNLPKWAKNDPKIFWKGVDDQPRQQTQLCKTIEISLPKEVSLDEQVKLVNDFVKDLLDGDIVPWGFVIHDKHDGNPHAHIQLAYQTHNDGIERPQDLYFKRADKKVPGRGGALRSENLLAKDFLNRARAKWEAHLNGVLESHGLPPVTRKKLADPSPDGVLPQIHLGANNNMIMKKGGTNERIKKFKEIESHNAQVRSLAKQITALRSRISWNPDDIFELVDDCELVDDAKLIDDSLILGVSNGVERGRGLNKSKSPIVSRFEIRTGTVEEKPVRKLHTSRMDDPQSINVDILPGDPQTGLGDRGQGFASNGMLANDNTESVTGIDDDEIEKPEPNIIDKEAELLSSLGGKSNIKNDILSHHKNRRR